MKEFESTHNKLLSIISAQTISKSEESSSVIQLLKWTQDPLIQTKHIVKDSCMCENCFQKKSNCLGIIQLEVKNNPFAVATAAAKKEGYKDFSEGSAGEKKRDEIAEAIKD